VAFIGPAAWLLGMLALAFRPSVGRSRVSFGLACGALLGALLIAAAETGTAALRVVPEPSEPSMFASYMTGQLVWVVAVLTGVVGYVLSRFARRLPGSPVARAYELGAVAATCALSLAVSIPAALLLSILGSTYCVGRWLDVHPVAGQRPDAFVLASLAAGFVLVYWRP